MKSWIDHPVEISVYEDRSYTLLKTPPASVLLVKCKEDERFYNAHPRVDLAVN
jgi:ribosomal protein L11